MPDERLIHLTIGHSVKVNALTDFERLVWLMYKLASDDFGVMRFSPTPLQNAADWLDQKPAKAVERALQRVLGIGLIATFGHQGLVYCFQPDWQTWQKITHPRQTKQPAPPLGQLDLNTQYLFDHHPKGAKLTAWQHPDLRPKTGRIPGKDREDSGSPPGKDPESSTPVFVSVGSDRVRDRVSGGAAPSRGFGGGAGGGSNPRDHLNCRQPCIRVCLSEKQHAILRERHGGTDADLDAFYASVRSRLDPDSPIGETPWKFWDAQFQAKFGAASVVNPRTVGNAAAAARFVARGKQ